MQTLKLPAKNISLAASALAVKRTPLVNGYMATPLKRLLI
jgi:hypothetical protein